MGVLVVRPESRGVQMSYPPPPQTLVSPEMSLAQSKLSSPYDMPSRSDSTSHEDHSGWTLHRSFSTPDGVSLADQSSTVPPGEKKRNKLGYHRTSVACSHCRGRKIRCIPAANDAQGRCASCIRLKRECSFKPTDQQRGTEARTRTAQAHMEQRSSQSTSPTPPGNSIQPPAQRQFPPLTTHAPHMRPAMSAAPMGNGVIAPLSAGQQYDFNSGMPSYVATNINPYLESAPSTWSNPWQGHQTESPISEHHPDTPLSAGWANGPGSQDAAWGGMPVPVRSMSYGGESIGNSPYGSMLPAGRHASGYGPVPTSTAEGFQIDAGSTASMPSHAPMHWQQHPHASRPPQAYSGWSQGGMDPLQASITTASDGEGASALDEI